jgi:pimeloyl-ACP methyl ester carboxylesterase
LRRPIRPAFASFQEGAPGSGIGRYRDERPAGPEKGTVLLLHGWAGTADLNWSHAYPQLLAAGYRVLAPDLPGHGRGARDVRFTLEVAADAAAKLITDAGAGKVVVAGHSMGGSIALLLASRHLEAVSGLVVMATQLSWPGIPPGWLLRPAGRLAALGARAILRWGGAGRSWGRIRNGTSGFGASCRLRLFHTWLMRWRRFETSMPAHLSGQSTFPQWSW